MGAFCGRGHSGDCLDQEVGVAMTTSLDTLQNQLLDAARAFVDPAHPLADLLATMAADVERAVAEPLEIFPVCHHSPSSALQMVRRLHQNPPRVLYIELCEDMLAAVEHLRDCKLPVALQAFAAKSEDFDPAWLPVSVVAPLTESSAEYQAIAYALEHPEITLVFVDRTADHIFQWREDGDEANGEAPPTEEASMHGRALAVEVGNLMPTFDQFLTFLLRNSNTRHYSEWWDQYVEQSILEADYNTYRQVMFLIGSLIRRLGLRKQDIENDRQRERYMWTRIKQHMGTQGVSPHEALYICGAAHAASDVEEFGSASPVLWEIPPLTQTRWLHGLIPSSFAAIEYQFHHPPGTVSLAEATWQKGLKSFGLRAFTLDRSRKAAPKSKKTLPETTNSSAKSFLSESPQRASADSEQLLEWCSRIVALARQNAYLASTADAIAIFQTSLLLAGMRNRSHPTPYDFQDAAITCLEKDRTPKKRNILQLCGILLGGDRVGTVGYQSLPPLARDVYDRLSLLGLNLQAHTNQRALMDFKSNPERLACSDVLWRLNRLLGNHIVQPIMGQRTLGFKPLQESWEVRIGKHQRELIVLGYMGITLEQVLEAKIRQGAFAAEAQARIALEAAEDSILYLENPHFTHELGNRAVGLLAQETGAEDAPIIFDRVRRLVQFYRGTTGLPKWIEGFVATGYAHYATLLPQAFADRGTSPEQIAGMLGFIFTLENLALALGCSRSQLLIGIQQVGQADEALDPAKLGLLWTAQWLLNQRSLEEIRAFFDQVVVNPMLVDTFPDYLNGFLLSLHFAPRLSSFLVELLSEVFAVVPDARLFQWLPGLILRLRPHHQLLKTLIREASTLFPSSLARLDQGKPLRLANASPTPTTTKPVLSSQEQGVRSLLFANPSTANCLVSFLCLPKMESTQFSPSQTRIRTLLLAKPATMHTLVELLEATNKAVKPNL